MKRLRDEVEGEDCRGSPPVPPATPQVVVTEWGVLGLVTRDMGHMCMVQTGRSGYGAPLSDTALGAFELHRKTSLIDLGVL